MSIMLDDVGKEIVKCMNMVKDGMYVVLMVFSGMFRFFREDVSMIEIIKVFFGEKIVDYMVLVFIYGDLVGEFKLKNMFNDVLEYL